MIRTDLSNSKLDMLLFLLLTHLDSSRTGTCTNTKHMGNFLKRMITLS